MNNGRYLRDGHNGNDCIDDFSSNGWTGIVSSADSNLLYPGCSPLGAGVAMRKRVVDEKAVLEGRMYEEDNGDRSEPIISEVCLHLPSRHS